MEPLDPILAKKLGKMNEQYVAQERTRKHRKRAVKAKKFPPGSFEEKILFYVADARSKKTIKFRNDVADYKLTVYILTIIEDVCLSTLDDLRSYRRDAGLTVARALFTYMERRFNRRSHPEIGAILNKDHASCMNLIDRIKEYEQGKIFQVYMKDARMKELFDMARKGRWTWERDHQA